MVRTRCGLARESLLSGGELHGGGKQAARGEATELHGGWRCGEWSPPPSPARRPSYPTPPRSRRGCHHHPPKARIDGAPPDYTANGSPTNCTASALTAGLHCKRAYHRTPPGGVLTSTSSINWQRKKELAGEGEEARPAAIDALDSSLG